MAIAFSGKNAKDVYTQTGISENTWKRMGSGKSQLTNARRERIIRVTGIPPRFLELGLEPLRAPISDLERETYQLRGELADLREEVRLLTTNYDDLVAVALAQLRVEDAALTLQDDAFRRLEEHARMRAIDQPPENQEEQDAR